MAALAEAFGFHLDRVSGSHHIFVRGDIRELVNLQDVKGKGKQFIRLAERYNLQLGDEA